ncbi:MAG: hypothetical protein RBR52_11670 [Thiomonas sp.]|uniref:hypothetical protein n=1 Tax=Thiomonas sp. TaxID=2047785 RepID=UPI002A35DBB4|nr:hypothetical protein [Thiomonas sp.]MDY0331136.1 hypothetical protein [Thiomonas sp.]
MKTLLRWLGLVFTLIVARILLAAAVLVVMIFAITAGLNALGLRPPTAAEIEQRLAPALREIAPIVQRIRAASPPASAASPATPESPVEPQPPQQSASIPQAAAAQN